MKKMKDKLCIFDFDGTLVNTIIDVAICFNKALKAYGFKEYNIREYNHLVGGDLETVVSKLLTEENRNEKNIYNVRNYYYDLYSKSKKENTKPYPYIIELLKELQEKKIKIGINTNKKQELTESLCKKFFPNINFIKIIGYSNTYPSKPNPEGVYSIIKEANSSKKGTLYIGDGNTDIETAKNAKIDMALVTWGQNTEEDLNNKYVKYIITNPKAIKDIIMEYN